MKKINFPHIVSFLAIIAISTIIIGIVITRNNQSESSSQSNQASIDTTITEINTILNEIESDVSDFEELDKEADFGL